MRRRSGSPTTPERTNIVRSGRVQDVEDGLSEFPHVILNQARVHDFYLEVMRNPPTGWSRTIRAPLIDLRPTSRRQRGTASTR